MTFDRIAAVATVLLLACAAAVHGANPPPPAASAPGLSPSLPPARVADCVSFALVDDKCTRDWYVCKRGPNPATCVDGWEECCTLRGQGARSKLGGAEPVSSNR